MKNDRHLNKKRKAAAALAIVLVLAMVLSIVAPFISSAYAGQSKTATRVIGGANGPTAVFVAEKGSDSSSNKAVDNADFTMEARIGFEQKFIVGQATPFHMVFTNEGEDFKGEVQIKIYTDGGLTTTGGEYFIYYQPIELAKGASKQINMEINVNSIRTPYKIGLFDTNGKEMYSKMIAAEPLDPSTIMVGILSDNQNDLKYLRNLKLADTEDDTYSGIDYDKIINLDSGTMPSSKSTMKQFKAIIVNDFDTKTLDENQTLALKEWVETGGVLILGTGPNANKVLSGLGNVFEYKIGSEKEITQYPTFNALFERNVEQYGGMSVTEINIENSNPVLEEDNTIITSSLKLGSGRIIVHSFDLGLAPFTNIDTMPIVLKSLYSQEAPKAFKVNIEDSYQYHYMNNLVGSMPTMKSGLLYSIFGLIVIYIVIVGPLLYLFLKKRDKREFGWVLIPIFAVLSTVLIFVISIQSPYKNSIMNIIGVVNLTEGSDIGNTLVTIGLKSPDKGEVKIQLDEKMDIKMISSNSSYYYNGNIAAEEEKDFCSRKILSSDSTEITYYENGSWGNIQLATDTVIDMKGEIVGDISINGNQFIGKIYNNTNMDFDDIVLSFGDRYVKYDSVKSGETLDIEYEIVPIDPLDPNARYMDYYEMIEEAFGIRDLRSSVGKGEVSREDAYAKARKAYMIQNLVGNVSESGMPIKMYAFNNNPLLDSNKLVNGKKAIELNENVFMKDFNIKLDNSKNFDIPFGFIKANSDGRSKGGDNYIYTDVGGEMEFTFELPEELKLDLFQIKWENGLNIVSEMSIFNIKTAQWEELSENNYTTTVDYISKSGQIKLRAEVQPNEQVELPQIRLKGGN